MSGFERGFLAKPAVKRLLATWPAHVSREPEPDEARRIAANNDALVTAAIDRFFRDTDPHDTKNDDVYTRGDSHGR